MLLTGCAGDAEGPGKAEADAETVTSASAFAGNPDPEAPAEIPDTPVPDEAVPDETVRDETVREEDPSEGSPVYSHVVIIGVDGAGAFFRDADTPVLDGIFEDGAVTYRCLTSDPTISAQCWGSLMTGVTPAFHRLSNSYIDAHPYPADSPFPTFFRVVREAMPDAALGSFCNWNPINVGIVEDGLGVTKGTAPGDSALTDMICKYVKNERPAVLFVQFDEVDGAGHGHGYGGKEHLAQLHTEDGYIGRIRDAYSDSGILDDTLFIVTADHGGKGNSHGGLTDAEKYVMWAAAGKTVTPGEIRDMEIRDTAAVVLWALGLSDRQPETWTARVPSGLFEGVEAGERPVYELEYLTEHRTRESVPTPDEGSRAPDLFGDRVLCYLPFDGDPDPAAGELTSEQKGKLYYVDGFFGNGAQFDDGSVSLSGWMPGMESFTVGMWLKTGGVSSDPCLFSDKNWASGSNPGFVLSLRDTDIKFNLGDGSSRMDSEFLLPMDFRDGWVYAVLAVDRESEEIRFSYDFGEFQTAAIPASLRGVSFDGLRKLNIGQDGTGRYPERLGAVLDEFLLIRGALTDEELASLAEFYGD